MYAKFYMFYNCMIYLYMNIIYVCLLNAMQMCYVQLLIVCHCYIHVFVPVLGVFVLCEGVISDTE